MNMPFASYGKARAPLARKVLALALAGLIIVPNQGRAAPGDLDASFGTGGKVTTDFAGDLDRAHAVALQTDGKIVAAGEAWFSGRANFVLARYNIDGSLDMSFGTGGKVTTDFAGYWGVANAVALQTDGKIIAAGGTSMGGTLDFALARYEAAATICKEAILSPVGSGAAGEWLK